MASETDPKPASQLLDMLKAENEALLRKGEALADLIGMSQSHLDKILSSERLPGAQSLRKIATYFARTRENASEADTAEAPRVPAAAPTTEPPPSVNAGATIRVLELGAVEQRQYIAAVLEGSGIPKGIASYVGLHVELDGSSSPAASVRAARELAQAMLDEEAAEEAASALGD
jgi:transcriptional regulator with XRE-family HTH domain